MKVRHIKKYFTWKLRENLNSLKIFYRLVKAILEEQNQKIEWWSWGEWSIFCYTLYVYLRRVNIRNIHWISKYIF